jgi:hypothetical protein
MDLLSLPRESFLELIKFCREEGSQWAKVVADPVGEIGHIDFNAADAAWSATRFVLFVLALTMAIQTPIYVAFTSLRIQQSTIFISLVMAHAVGICTIGLWLYFPAKLLAGKGSFWDCILTGSYLGAFWPLALLCDYLLWADPWARNLRLSGWDFDKAPEMSAHDETAMLIYLVVNSAVCVWLLVKVLPVVKLLHSMGTIRAFMTIAIGYVLYGVIFYEFFEPLLTALNRAK